MGHKRPDSYASCRQDLLRFLPPKSIGAEIGVFRGRFTKDIIRIVRPAHLYLVDVWWTQFGERYPDWGDYTDHGKLGTHEAHAEVGAGVEELGWLGCTTIHVGGGTEFLQSLPESTLDWVYIDSSHGYQATKAELAAAHRAVKSRGVLCGHDWREDPEHTHHGVALAVTEFAAQHGIHVALHRVEVGKPSEPDQWWMRNPK